MSQPVTRRDFAAAGAAALAAVTLPSGNLSAAPTQDSPAGSARSVAALDVRPYQLMCIVCRIGEGRTDDLGDPRLNAIAAAVRQDRKTPLTLRCNVDTVYRYQNPGHDADTPEGELFNTKRDLDILQKMGLVPGDTRPAVDLFPRLVKSVTTTKGICGCGEATADCWRGCPRAEGGLYEKGRETVVATLLPPPSKEEKADRKKTSAAAVYEAKTLRIRPHHLMCMSCFFGGRPKLAPIPNDNLFEAIDVIQKNPQIPVTLIAGCCMICPPCPSCELKTNLCLGGKSMALRDQKKDLDVLQKLGLKYGDTLPGQKVFELLYEKIAAPMEVCGYGDGQERSYEWSICGSAKTGQAYQKAREAKLGLNG